MRANILTALVVAAASFAAAESRASDYVRGHFRSSGTYVAPYHRSHADGNFYNNWSSYPNVNPYTGRIGTHYTPYNYRYTPTYSYGLSRWGW